MSGVLAVLEHRGDVWNRMSWEALAAAQELAGTLAQPLAIALVGRNLDAFLPEATNKEAKTVYAVRHDLLEHYTFDGYTGALDQLIRKVDPAYVVFPHTYQVRDFAPRLATRFQQVLVADVIAIQSGGSQPVFVRQLFQGKLNANCIHTSEGPCFISIQAGAFRADASRPGSASVEMFQPTLEPSQIRTKPGEPFRESAQTVDLGSANIIVSVGRGIREKDNLSIVEELSKALGAELAASRPICDNGWLPMQRQVGSSGQTVSPKLYIAIGISGAIQHLVGMKGSKAIVAINKDENAPIFEVADYGIVGDLFEVIPAMTAAVKKARGA